jgi:hypothetical protein
MSKFWKNASNYDDITDNQRSINRQLPSSFK